MLRKRISVILAIMLILILSMPVEAADKIIESPNVKIIIDGVIGDYTDTPLIVNDRTMLPLREVLVNLGVQNDDEHIIWNGEERSVTVIKDDTTIKLTIDSNTAYVNDEPITLDVTPMIYAKNNRTYIPARFISESLGKKVLWDGSTTAVLITDQAKVDEIMAILEASNTAMDEVNRFKLDMLIDFNVESEEMPIILKMDTSGEFDLENNAIHSNDIFVTNMLFGAELKIESEEYLVDGVKYSKSSMFNGSWTKQDVIDTTAEFQNADVTKTMEADEIMAAGLTISDESTDELWVLEGGAYVTEIVGNTKDMSADYGVEDAEYTFDDYVMQIHINKETHYVEYMKISMEMTSSYEDVEEINMSILFEMSFSDFNGDFTITVPQEVLDSVSEMSYQIMI